ncbi:hypothetical protein Emed_002931 [Eimeria media]
MAESELKGEPPRRGAAAPRAANAAGHAAAAAAAAPESQQQQQQQQQRRSRKGRFDKNSPNTFTFKLLPAPQQLLRAEAAAGQQQQQQQRMQLQRVIPPNARDKPQQPLPAFLQQQLERQEIAEEELRYVVYGTQRRAEETGKKVSARETKGEEDLTGDCYFPQDGYDYSQHLVGFLCHLTEETRSLLRRQRASLACAETEKVGFINASNCSSSSSSSSSSDSSNSRNSNGSSRRAATPTAAVKASTEAPLAAAAAAEAALAAAAAEAALAAAAAAVSVSVCLQVVSSSLAAMPDEEALLWGSRPPLLPAAVSARLQQRAGVGGSEESDSEWEEESEAEEERDSDDDLEETEDSLSPEEGEESDSFSAYEECFDDFLKSQERKPAIEAPRSAGASRRRRDSWSSAGSSSRSSSNSSESSSFKREAADEFRLCEIDDELKEKTLALAKLQEEEEEAPSVHAMPLLPARARPSWDGETIMSARSGLSVQPRSITIGSSRASKMPLNPHLALGTGGPLGAASSQKPKRAQLPPTPEDAEIAFELPELLLLLLLLLLLVFLGVHGEGSRRDTGGA